MGSCNRSIYLSFKHMYKVIQHPSARGETNCLRMRGLSDLSLLCLPKLKSSLQFSFAGKMWRESGVIEIPKPKQYLQLQCNYNAVVNWNSQLT